MVSAVSAAELQELYRRFTRLDRDYSGTLSVEELLSVPEFAMNPLAPRIIEILNLDEQELDFTNFARLLSIFHVNSKASDKLKCKPSHHPRDHGTHAAPVLFRIYNLDNDGLLKRNEVLHVLRLMAGDHLEESQLAPIVDKVFREADMDGDGLIDFQEFTLVSLRRSTTWQS